MGTHRDKALAEMREIFGLQVHFKDLALKPTE